jgi:hypothetical protein
MKNVRLPYKFIIAALTAVALAAPLSALAFLPIGGKIVSEIPCPHSVGFIVTVVGFGVGTGVFWYLPGATITYLYGPPILGEWILGLSDVPSTCGARMTMTGTSVL